MKCSPGSLPETLTSQGGGSASWLAGGCARHSGVPCKAPAAGRSHAGEYLSHDRRSVWLCLQMRGPAESHQSLEQQQQQQQHHKLQDHPHVNPAIQKPPKSSSQHARRQACYAPKHLEPCLQAELMADVFGAWVDTHHGVMAERRRAQAAAQRHMQVSAPRQPPPSITRHLNQQDTILRRAVMSDCLL